MKFNLAPLTGRAAGSHCPAFANSVMILLALMMLATAAYSEETSCCTGMTGNIDCDPSGLVDVGDVTAFLDYLFISFDPLCCPEAANCDGDSTGGIDVGDFTALLGYLFIDFQPIAGCAGPSMSDSVRMAVLTTAAQVNDSLSADPQYRQKMVNWLLAQPEFEAAGATDNPSSIWARFDDDILFVISAERPGATMADPDAVAHPDSLLDAMSSAGSIATPRTSRRAVSDGQFYGLPMSSGVRMLNTLGSYYSPVTGVLGSWLSDNGYTVANTDETVTALRTVGGDGVFFFSTHGGIGIRADNGEEYGLWTSTLAERATLPLYIADLRAGRLIFQLGALDTNAAGQSVDQLHYGITAAFITHYWQQFANNSLVYIDACGSDGPAAQAVKNAIIAKNASVYFGWSHSVYSDASNLVSKFMFDRLLGANLANPKETPPQRPFDYESVYADLVRRHLHEHPTIDSGFATTKFQATHGVGGFGLLAPSIKTFEIHEWDDTLYIWGRFGEDPGEADRRVTVNGVELPVGSWFPNLIRAFIPNTGGGSSGPLIVESRAPVGELTPLTYRKSNTVNVTEWRGDMRYQVKNSGSLTANLVMHLHVRIDLQPFRNEAGDPPVDSIMHFEPVEDSYGSTSGAGSYTVTYGEVTVQWAWSGGGYLAPIWDDYQEDWFYYGAVDAAAHTLTLNMVVGVDSAYIETYTQTNGPGWTFNGPVYLTSGLYDDPENFSFNLMLEAGTYDILGGVRTSSEPGGYDGSGVQYHLEWDRMTCSYPPDVNAPQAPPVEGPDAPTILGAAKR